MGFENRFNDMNSKEWLPFQKSWFKFSNLENLYYDNLRFFLQPSSGVNKFYYSGNQNDTIAQLTEGLNLEIVNNIQSKENPIDFALIDLLDLSNSIDDLDAYTKLKNKVVQSAIDIFTNLNHRKFLAVFINNFYINDKYFTFAWDIAKTLSSIFSLKDEKIACLLESNKDNRFTEKGYFYCMYFRKDENSNGIDSFENIDYCIGNDFSGIDIKTKLPSWFVLKPAPRTKSEILHPAKYPEELVDIFIDSFTNINDNVFDPMSGTGSTQLAALKKNRNAYGTELSEFFSDIAIKRCNEYISPTNHELFDDFKTHNTFKILNKDARLVNPLEFPPIDIIVTSPPYWDMLNMKGAENQAKRIEKGLQTNYSNDHKDLGNILDYNEFLDELVDIYLNISNLLQKGKFLTIIVKNIKKQGKNYPLAWDLSLKLRYKFKLLPEIFWCQDDINIAPYGYGNTWVSNTFHQYCLTFQKI